MSGNSSATEFTMNFAFQIFCFLLAGKLVYLISWFEIVLTSICFLLYNKGTSIVQAADKVTVAVPKEACVQSRFKLPGCYYKGRFIGEGKTVQISVCESCTCECGNPICYVMDCARPPAGCSYMQTVTECCKLVCKKGCTYNGIIIPEGETRTVAPCQYGTCSGGQVFIAIADCALPNPGCHYESTMEECCKEICDEGCNYSGIIIPEGETRPVAPCEWADCSGGVVSVKVADCQQPQPGCHLESTLEECCKQVCDGAIEPPVFATVSA